MKFHIVDGDENRFITADSADEARFQYWDIKYPVARDPAEPLVEDLAIAARRASLGAKVVCALIDRERLTYLGMVEVDEADLGAQHLPQITECDLPANEYRWQPEEGNPLGGHFLPLPPKQRAVAGEPTEEQALAFTLLRMWEADPQAPADVSLRWLDGRLKTLDFRAYIETPLVQAYAKARGIDLTDKDFWK